MQQVGLSPVQLRHICALLGGLLDGPSVLLCCAGEPRGRSILRAQHTPAMPRGQSATASGMCFPVSVLPEYQLPSLSAPGCRSLYTTDVPGAAACTRAADGKRTGSTGRSTARGRTRGGRSPRPGCGLARSDTSCGRSLSRRSTTRTCFSTISSCLSSSGLIRLRKMYTGLTFRP